MTKKLALISCILSFWGSGAALSQQHSPMFCNPVDIPYRYAVLEEGKGQKSYREAADPTVIVFNGEYYLFASKCGVYYHSTDLVNWDAIETSSLPMEGYAPTVVEFDGALYFTHSVGTTHIWRTTDPKSGRWELVEGAGTERDEADPMLFVDNGRIYLYYGSSGNPEDAIMGVELDRNTLRPIGEPVRLLAADVAHNGWEVMGDYNHEYQRNSWLEGAWVNKYGGKYYLQYSAPGTEMKSYCDAIYVSDRPLGPYTLQRHNPFSYHPEGFIPAAGHGSTFEDNNGNLWHIATGTISRRHMFERRLVLYPVFVDEDSLMYAYTGFGDYPMVIPQKKTSSPQEYSSGWMLLSYRRPVEASSSMSNHPAEYAVNEDIRSWWSAESAGKGEFLTVDLGDGCEVCAVQVNFADEDATLSNDRKSAYRYKLDVSSDGKKWKTLADKSRNRTNAPHEFITLKKKAPARYVRLTNIDCPSGKFSVSGLRVFGHAGKSLPAKTQFVNASRNMDDLRQATLTWNKSDGATGYNIRYGTDPDKLYQNYKVYGDTALVIRSLDARQGYFFAVDAFNEAGVAPGVSIAEAKTDDGTFANPVLYVDVPDPDVIRVGDNFYMVSTTMHFSPGCPIMKSSDLVNWQVAGYAHDQLEETDNFALRNGQNDYARGSWAANLRYDPYEKLFYLIVTCNTTQKSYIFTTPDIEAGRWHRNEVDMCYDPGLLFDDNGSECRKYIVHPDYDLGRHACYIREIISDGKGNVSLGKRERLIDYTQIENPSQGLRAEGYHGYHIGDYYYIFMIQGQGAQRQETVWRSRSLQPGTFEARKIFTGNIVNSDGSGHLPSTGVAQGGVVDTPDGKWYALLFQDYGAVGRIPVLIPVEWKDGWPMLGNNGKSVDRRLPLPVAGSPKFFPVVSDEFDNQPSRYVVSDVESEKPEYAYYGSNLKPEWQWNHNPDNRYWSLKERPGYLRLTAGHKATSIRDARNTLTQRTFGPASTAETLLEFTGMNDGDCAGIAVFQNQYGFVGVKKENGKFWLVMQRARQKDDAQGEEMERIALDGDKVCLRAECDFRNQADKAYFYYSLDGYHWNQIGDSLQMRFDWPDFVGQRFGLFNYATENTGGYADFDYFRVSDQLRHK